MNELNLNDVESYFKFFSLDEKTIFTCALMPKNGRGVVPGFGCWFGTLAEILHFLPANLIESGATLHHTLNQTKLTGRKKKDIENCRVLCCDIDRQISVAELKQIVTERSVQMAVESSPGKYHLYWRLDPGVGLERWSEFQGGIAKTLGGDPNLCDITHIIRVPGVGRLCKDGSEFLPRILDLESLYEEIGSDAASGTEV